MQGGKLTQLSSVSEAYREPLKTLPKDLLLPILVNTKLTEAYFHLDFPRRHGTNHDAIFGVRDCTHSDICQSRVALQPPDQHMRVQQNIHGSTPRLLPSNRSAISSSATSKSSLTQIFPFIAPS